MEEGTATLHPRGALSTKVPAWLQLPPVPQPAAVTPPGAKTKPLLHPLAMLLGECSSCVDAFSKKGAETLLPL